MSQLRDSDIDVGSGLVYNIKYLIPQTFNGQTVLYFPGWKAPATYFFDADGAGSTFGLAELLVDAGFAIVGVTSPCTYWLVNTIAWGSACDVENDKWDNKRWNTFWWKGDSITPTFDAFSVTSDFNMLQQLFSKMSSSELVDASGVSRFVNTTQIHLFGHSSGAYMTARLSLRQAVYAAGTSGWPEDILDKFTIRSAVVYGGGLVGALDTLNNSGTWSNFPPLAFVHNPGDMIVSWSGTRGLFNNYLNPNNIHSRYFLTSAAHANHPVDRTDDIFEFYVSHSKLSPPPPPPLSPHPYPHSPSPTAHSPPTPQSPHPYPPTPQSPQPILYIVVLTSGMTFIGCVIVIASAIQGQYSTVVQ